MPLPLVTVDCRNESTVHICYPSLIFTYTNELSSNDFFETDVEKIPLLNVIAIA